MINANHGATIETKVTGGKERDTRVELVDRMSHTSQTVEVEDEVVEEVDVVRAEAEDGAIKREVEVNDLIMPDSLIKVEERVEEGTIHQEEWDGDRIQSAIFKKVIEVIKFNVIFYCFVLQFGKHGFEFLINFDF